MAKKTIFVVIDFDYVTELLDYPKHLPIPQIGHIVNFESKSGKVTEVRHTTSGDVTEIKIICKY